ncbi:FKBP-type peptidyl-prolyl cis-trans isomerase [Agriterribacter sp.]|uniref:FKBP-type peptidyl-prolyl cis-trans isomerase n=1 Tax=Agriterribacter sp. TaxID=2821509 RepID=UPI002C6D0041|nr:FKBP-type peptidyl-prolyl cis-trans isomerase [Agriterribacter sp.]HRP55150.1 FKBP-type peptidyl-prolyl cis-trans isomerase [Agriterribacter sp.]
MRKISVYAFIVSLVFVSCLKKETGCPYNELSIKAPGNEVQQVETYLAAKNITAQKDSSGVYYVIENTGTGKTPDVCSVVSVHYTGSLTNDQVFDKSDGTPVSFRLGELIAGWQKGLKHIKAGGKIKLFIPPSLGYGDKDAKDANGNVIIPANSILVFSLELTGVQ